MKSDKKELDKIIINKIESYYDELPLIPLTKEKYLASIRDLYAKDSSQTIDEFMIKVKNYTLTLIMNSNNYLDFINDYINKHYSFTLNRTKINNYFKELDKMFIAHKDIIDINNIINLLQTNKLLYSLVEVCFKSNEKSIINNRINDTIDCKILISLIEAYCLINNIEIKEDNTLDYDNDVDVMNYDTDSLENYLREIKKFKVLSRDEERELITKAKSGDREALNKLMACNLRLVASIVLRHYRNREIPELDLIQEGSFGLIKAIEKYDLNTNYKFSTYAYSWIRQNIDRAIYTKGRNIYIPIHMQENMKKYKKKIHEFELTYKRKPSIEEIIKITGFTEDKIELIQTYLSDTISYDITTGDDDEKTIIDLIPDESNKFEELANEQDKKDKINIAITNAGLTIREKDVIRRRFGFNGEIETLESIGNFYGVTKERIRIIEKSALRKLKEYFEKNNLLYKDNFKVEIINKKPIKSLYDYFKEYTPEQIDYALNFLDDDCKNIISLKFGGNLKNPIKRKLTEIQERKFHTKVLPRLAKILDMIYPENKLYNNHINMDTCNILLMLFRIYPFTRLQQEIAYNTLMVGLLESGYVDNIRYTEEAIAEFLNKDKVDVIILKLEFNKLIYQNKLLKDIIENKQKYLKLVKEKNTRII